MKMTPKHSEKSQSKYSIDNYVGTSEIISSAHLLKESKESVYR